MKTLTLLISIFLFPALLFCQAIAVVEGSFKEAVYSSSEDKIYAITTSFSEPQANSLCRIDPHTATVEECFSLGPVPASMAINHDETAIYIGLNSSYSLIRFNLATNSIDYTVSTGIEGGFGGLYFPENILPIRGHSDRVAVAIGNNGASHQGVFIFEAGSLLPNNTASNNHANSLTYSGTDSLILGYNNENSGFELRRLSVNSNGVVLNDSYNFFNGFHKEIEYLEGKVYSTSGERATLIDDIPNFDGTYPFIDMPSRPRQVEPIPDENIVYFLHNPSSGNSSEYILEQFRKDSLILVEETTINIPDGYGDVTSLFNWGSYKNLAFTTNLGLLAIIRFCTPALTGAPAQPILLNEVACVGQEVILAVPEPATSFGQIVWQDGQIGDSLTITSSGTYSYSVIDSLGCPSSVSESLDIDFAPSPPTPLTSTPLGTDLCQTGGLELRAFDFGYQTIWSNGDTTHTTLITEPGVYSAYYIGPSGCRSLIPRNITISSINSIAPLQPELALGPIIDTCTIEPITLDAPTGYDRYRWYQDQSFFSFQEDLNLDYTDITHEYQLIIIDSAGCASWPTEPIPVTFRVPPSTPTLTYDEPNDLLSSSFNGTNYWYLNGEFIAESPDAFFQPLQSGLYSVSAFDEICLSELSLPINVITTSLSTLQSDNQIIISPNPTQGRIRLELSDDFRRITGQQKLSFLIIDANGRLIDRQLHDGGLREYLIDFGDIPSGIYQFVIIANQSLIRRELIKH